MASPGSYYRSLTYRISIERWPVQQMLDVSLQRMPARLFRREARQPRTGGRRCAEQRRHRLEIWAEFIERELQAHGMRPAQLALYANVHASTVSIWRHRKSLPDREAVVGVAHCFRLPVEYVAEKAGMLPPTAQRDQSRVHSDPEWRVLLTEIDGLPHDEFDDVKSALRIALSMSRQRAS